MNTQNTPDEREPFIPGNGSYEDVKEHFPPPEINSHDDDEGEGFCMGGMELGGEDWPG